MAGAFVFVKGEKMSFWKKKPKKRLKPKAKVSTSQSSPINKPKMETRQPDPSHIECGKNPHYKERQKIMPPVKRLDSKKEFMDIFNQLTYRHRRWDVWSDFVVMFACALSNPLDKSHFDEREKRYLKIIKKYDKREQQLFPDLAAHTVMALEENPEQDFLGDIYMRMNLGSQTRGQFFTPYSISRLMAEMTVDDVVSRVEQDGYITIGDSCCGGGSTLIAGIHAARERLERVNLNYQNHILVAAQDVDETVALMCYIQLSLLGVAGYIKIGNTFTEPIAQGDSMENYWFTPMYFSDVWTTRRMLKKMEALLQ